MSYIEKLKIINPDELNLEEVKSKYLQEWAEVRGREYPYSSKEYYKAMEKYLNCNDILSFCNLEDIIGIDIDDDTHIEDEKIGKYYTIERIVPESRHKYKTIGGVDEYIEPEHVESESRFHRYNRSEIANKYLQNKNNNKELKDYISKLSESNRKSLEAMLVESAYILFSSIYGAPSLSYAYPIHGDINWQWYGNCDKAYPIGMRNIFAKIINDNNLNFTQSIVLAILFPEFITNENYSELVPCEDNNFVCCNTYNRNNKRSLFHNEDWKTSDHTIIIKQELIDKIKYVFDDNYIFKLAPMETYALKSKFDILFKEDWFSKYPSISKQSILDLIFYTKDEKELIKYLEMINYLPESLQEKVISFIEPISSYISLKKDYLDDELYNILNYINTLKFYKGNYIKFDPELYIKDYRGDYKNIYSKTGSWFSKWTFLDKCFSIDEIENARFHIEKEISTPTRIFDKEFNINVNTDIWSMHTHFVDAFETYFREQYTLLVKLLESQNCEKYLDELLRFKDIIIKYAYINSTITLDQYHDYNKLRDLQKKDYEKAYEKVIAVRSIMDDEISLVLEQIRSEKKDHENNVFDDCNEEKVFILTKNKKD